jgi:hypothetical protein
MTTDTSTTRYTSKLLCLVALFVLALVPRLYSAQTLGWGWDYPGSFTLVNFDEAGSCRAALGGFDYSTFVGGQTIALAQLIDKGPPEGIAGNHAVVKAYCHSADHILVARTFAAITGSLTVVLVALITLMLVPANPAVAWTAAGLLALSGFHISESHSGTVDAPSVFFIYLFLAVMIFAVTRGSRLLLCGSPLLLLPAIWSKYWLFAVFAYLAWVPLRAWQYMGYGMSPGRIAVVLLATAVLVGLLSTREFQQAGLYPLLAAYYLVIPWRSLHRPMMLFWLAVPVLAYGICQIDYVANYTTSGISGIFGTAYGAIGWHKWLRNPLDLLLVLVVGLGLPACLFIPAGLRMVAKVVAVGEGSSRAWLCLLPVLLFALYMVFVSPITYYRHYLALLPAVAILVACGLYATAWSGRRWFMVLFFLWPALLALDLVGDYHRDPRIELRQWYAQHEGATVLASYYVNPPASSTHLFQPEYAFGDAAALRKAQYLILSENWYDTAFANELNGPLTGNPDRLIKTKPEYVEFYRSALAGSHPHLELERSIDVQNFMPELLLHRAVYGTFQLFVGDIRVFRVVD